MHQTLFILSTQYLCACDQSTDYIEIYKADVQSGLLIHRSMLHLYGGPRYLASTNDTLCYLCHELSNEVTVLYMYNDVLCVQQTLSTIPEETVKTVSASRLSQNQQHLYASNRGRGSIAVFNMLPDGLLKAAGHWNAGALHAILYYWRMISCWWPIRRPVFTCWIRKVLRWISMLM